MSGTTIDGTCACGARLVWSGDSAYAKSTAAAFRADHRHAVAAEPGPCWADSGIFWPGRISTVRCDLKAGHAGAHEADRGDMGGRAVWTEATVAAATEEPTQ